MYHDEIIQYANHDIKTNALKTQHLFTSLLAIKQYHFFTKQNPCTVSIWFPFITDYVYFKNHILHSDQSLMKSKKSNKRTSGMGAVRPAILRVGYDGGGP